MSVYSSLQKSIIFRVCRGPLVNDGYVVLVLCSVAKDAFVASGQP